MMMIVMIDLKTYDTYSMTSLSVLFQRKVGDWHRSWASAEIYCVSSPNLITIVSKILSVLYM